MTSKCEVICFTEYCRLETFHPSCPASQVIIITHAWYGRMKIGECVKRDYGLLGCAENQLSTLDKRCSGKAECSISIPDHEMTADIPCIEELSPYLEARYICQKGNSVYVSSTEKGTLLTNYHTIT